MDTATSSLYTYFRYALPSDVFAALITLRNNARHSLSEKDKIRVLTYDLGLGNATRNLNGNDGNKRRVERFKLYCRDFTPEFGDLELEQRYYKTLQIIQNDDPKHHSSFMSEDPTLFNLILAYAHKALNHDLLNLRCNFDEIFTWQETTHILGQDLITCASYAYATEKGLPVPHALSWNRVLSSDYQHARGLFGEGNGLTENHFHLWGSSCTFDVAWTLMMNKPQKIRGIVRDKKLELENIMGSGRLPWFPEENLWDEWITRAAIIRAFLFTINTKINGETIFARDYANQRDIDIEDEIIDILQYPLRKRNQFITTVDLRHKYGERIAEYSPALNPEAAYDDDIYDYAFTHEAAAYTISSPNRMFVGERNFLISCFKNVFTMEDSRKSSAFTKQLLYLYLLIKSRFRGEMVQSNNRPGFDNFSRYERRKDAAFSGFPYDREVIHYAINAVHETQNVNSLELRIVPKGDADKKYNEVRSIIAAQSAPLIARQIANNNELLSINGRGISVRPPVRVVSHSTDALMNNYPNDLLCDRGALCDAMKTIPYHFVWHFTKSRDLEEPVPHNNFSNYIPKRNSMVRRNNINQAFSIMYLLDVHPEMREIIRGIDGCSEEIGCRPEVMACAFRFISQYTPEQKNHQQKKYLKTLKRTFHVGEGYLDLIDGLRAIDEARFFLNLQTGDRLGHATALGINAREYYDPRNGTISLNCQDMADSLSWLLQRAPEWGVDMPENLRIILTRNFREVVHEVYKNYEVRHEIIKESDKWYNFYTDPDKYFTAWHLRGDEPDRYLSKLPAAIREDARKFETLDINNSMESTLFSRHSWVTHVRNNYDYAIELYRAYHFDAEVRKHGNKREDFTIPSDVYDAFINIVSGIQRKMREKLFKNRINIETNPTSNRLISTFKHYNNHPIFTMYDPMQDGRVQLSVSINTDDQGVFETSLENEYTLILAAMLDQKDEQGNWRFTRHQAHEYIRSVRRMSERQSFRQPELFNRF